jgi:hypothetical protein
MARLQPFGNELSPANQELERNVAFRQWNTTPRSVTFRGLSIRPVTTGAVPQANSLPVSRPDTRFVADYSLSN